MSGADFRALVDAAIEARRPLDTAAFARLAACAAPADREYWRTQVGLDRAIDGWRETRPSARVRGRVLRVTGSVAAVAVTRVWRGVGTAQTAATMALGLSAAFLWWSRAPVEEPPAVAMFSPAEPVKFEDPEKAVPSIALPDLRDDASVLAVAAPAAPPHDFAKAADTAERLAYAFQPVGERVGSVVRLLIDSVPGSDVFSM